MHRFAHEVHAASRYVTLHPPQWCVPRQTHLGRSAPFHFFEVLEQHVAWEAYLFLQAAVGFSSAIWLHDGFWVAPCPNEELLRDLNCHLVRKFGFAASDPLLMRCDHLGRKRDVLITQLSSHVSISTGMPAGAVVQHPLPLTAQIWRKRRYQAADEQHQAALEQRLGKRAPVANG